MKLRILALLVVLSTLTTIAAPRKREFRGAWIQTIYQGYDRRTTDENRVYLCRLLDELQQAGVNAVFFQVRPRADALYRSDLEPWSRFISGAVGKAPSPEWDPLEFMVHEAHMRGMELHAWLNPYRAATVEESASLPANDLLKTNPERFLRYGKGYYFNPSLQVNRNFICEVVKDIAGRYDIDGIHFDDYFYPYPIKGEAFPDAKDYAAAKTKMSRADWRRHNVDLLIGQVSAAIDSVKPWLRFGVSPFGIWRNAKSDPRGSKTNGLSNYDDLYADVPLWAERGWIDYQIPQLYWQMDHRVAPYRELASWWTRNARGRHIYIGQDAENIIKHQELDPKMRMAAKVDGNCWWYAAALAPLSSKLKANHYVAPALVPEYPWKKVDHTSRPLHLRYNGGRLRWAAEPAASKWVVYRFDSPESIDIENPAAICGVTYMPSFVPQASGTYVITALDRANGESLPSSPIVIEL